MNAFKMHLSAIAAGFRAYRETLVSMKQAEARRQRDEYFRQAAKNDPLSLLFECKYSRASMEADFRDGKF